MFTEEEHFHFNRKIASIGAVTTTINPFYTASEIGSQLNQLKIIAIFTYKQWLLSLHMKTKVVQHVQRITHVHHWNHVNQHDKQLLLSLHLKTRWQPWPWPTPAAARRRHQLEFSRGRQGVLCDPGHHPQQHHDQQFSLTSTDNFVKVWRSYPQLL